MWTLFKGCSCILKAITGAVHKYQGTVELGSEASEMRARANAFPSPSRLLWLMELDFPSPGSPSKDSMKQNPLVTNLTCNMGEIKLLQLEATVGRCCSLILINLA